MSEVKEFTPDPHAKLVVLTDLREKVALLYDQVEGGDNDIAAGARVAYTNVLSLIDQEWRS